MSPRPLHIKERFSDFHRGCNVIRRGFKNYNQLNRGIHIIDTRVRFEHIIILYYVYYKRFINSAAFARKTDMMIIGNSQRWAS